MQQRLPASNNPARFPPQQQPPQHAPQPHPQHPQHPQQPPHMQQYSAHQGPWRVGGGGHPQAGRGPGGLPPLGGPIQQTGPPGRPPTQNGPPPRAYPGVPPPPPPPPHQQRNGGVPPGGGSFPGRGGPPPPMMQMNFRGGPPPDGTGPGRGGPIPMGGGRGGPQQYYPGRGPPAQGPARIDMVRTPQQQQQQPHFGPRPPFTPGGYPPMDQQHQHQGHLPGRFHPPPPQQHQQQQQQMFHNNLGGRGGGPLQPYNPQYPQQQPQQQQQIPPPVFPNTNGIRPHHPQQASLPQHVATTNTGLTPKFPPYASIGTGPNPHSLNQNGAAHKVPLPQQQHQHQTPQHALNQQHQQQHQQAPLPIPTNNFYQQPQYLQQRACPANVTAATGQASATNSSSTGATTATLPPPVERPWEEYTDPSSGNKYYSNGIITQWTKPEAMIQAAASQEEEEVAEPSTKKRKLVVESIKLNSKEEALRAFKELLAEHEVTPVQKWIETVKLLGGSKDAATLSVWEGCEKVLTTGERKQALAEYQTKLANEIRTKERQCRQRAKKAYLKLVSEVIPTVSSKNQHGQNGTGGGGSTKGGLLQFRDVQGFLQKDDRYHAVEDDSTREALFVEYWDEHQKREERKKQSEKRDAQNSFVDFLKRLVDHNLLTCDARGVGWDAFVAALDPVDYAARNTLVNQDSQRFILVSSDTTPTTIHNAASLNLDEPEKDFLFRRFVSDLERAQEEERRRTQEDARRAQVAQREFFRTSLVRLAQDGKILPSSSFSSVSDTTLQEESSFIELIQYDRDRPRELFEEFVTDWNELYRGDRLFLSDIVRRSYERLGRNIISSDGATSYEAFCQALLDEAEISPDTHHRVQRIIQETSLVSSAKLYFNELQQRSSQQQQNRNGSGDADSSEDEGEISE